MAVEREIIFRINAALSSQFADAMRAAQSQISNMNRQQQLSRIKYSDAMKALQDYQGKLSAIQGNIARFKNLNQAVGQSSAALVQARQRAAQLRQEHQRQQRQTEEMSRAYDRLKEVYRENQSSMSAEQRSAMREQIRAAGQELSEQRRRESAALRESTGGGQEVSRLEGQLTRQRNELAQLRASMSNAGVNVSQLAQEEARLEQEITSTTNALRQQEEALLRQQAARDRHSNASENFQNARDNFQNSLSTAQSIMSPFVDAVKVSMNFNSAMSEVQAISGATGEDFEALRNQAKELGSTTNFSASEAAAGMKYLAMAGWDTNQILRGMPDMLSLAEASGTDLARTADIVSDGMTAFNMDLNKTPDAANRFANAMIAAATGSNTSVELMGETFKYAGAVAGSLGYSVEDVALATGLMANASIKGSMAGTALRSTFTRLVKPPKEAAAALDALGVSATNSDGTMKPFRTTLGDLRTAFKGLSEAEKAEYAATIAGQEAMAGFLAMMNASDSDFDKLQNRIDTAQSSNLLGNVQDVMNDNLEDSFKSLGSAWEGLLIAIGDAFQEPLKNLVNSVAEGLGELVQFIDKHQDLARAAGVAAAAIAGIIVVTSGFSVAAAGIEYLSASFAALRVQAIGSAAAQRAAQLASLSWSGIGAGISGAFTSLTTKIAAARTAMVSFFTTAAATNGASVISSITGIGSAFLSAARGAMAFVFSPIGVALLALAAAGYYVYTHWSQVAPVFQSLANVLGGALQGAIQTLGPAFESLSNSASRLGPAFSQIGQVVFTVFAVVANVVVRVAALIITTFANAIKTVIDLFSGLGNVAASVLAGDFSGALEHASKTWDQYKENFSKGWDDIFKGVKDIGQNWDAPMEIMSKAKDLASGDAVSRHAVQSQPQPVDTGKIVEVIAATFKNVTQEQNKDADLSKVAEAVQSAVDAVKQDPKTDIAPLLQQVSTAIEAVKKENPEADTAKLESVLSSAMQEISAAQQEQAQVQTEPLQEAANNLSAPLQEAGESMATFAPMTQQAGEGMLELSAGEQMLTAETQNAAAANQANNAALQTAGSALAGFNSALASTNGGLANLSSSSSSAAGAISGLGSAAQSAVAALQSAGAQAAAAVNAAAANVGKPAANFKGGIYSKGAFLTTFAEKTPEAAIPIDNSQRAVDLWTQTGQMLGTLPGKSSIPEQSPPAIEYDELGNIVGLNGLQDNLITKADDIQVTRAKKAAQMREWQTRNNSGKLNSTLPISQFTLPSLPRQNSPAIEYDELGNIVGLNGLQDNLITKADDIQVTRAKKAAQLKEWQTRNNTGKMNSAIPIPHSPLPPAAQMKEWQARNNSGKMNSALPISQFTLPSLPRQNSPAIEYDELGNIVGLNGLQDNLITKADDIQVTRAKKAAQLKEWQSRNNSGKLNSALPIPHSTLPPVPRGSSRGSIFGERMSRRNLPMTQTQPRTYDSDISLGSIFSAIGGKLGINGNILTAVSDRLSAEKSEGIIPPMLNNFPQSQPEGSPIDLHFEINIAGNANAEDVEQGIRQSIPMLEETFERKMANYRHEQQRRMF